MNKRILQNHIILAGCCLLFASTQVVADRPSMSERSEPFEPEIIDISTDLESMPVFENMPEQEHRPSMDDTSTMESRPALESMPETVMDEVSSVEESIQQERANQNQVEPTIPVNEQNADTETEITGDVVELQAGDTLPIIVIDFPRRGMTMDKVRNELGPALSVSDAVGEPPITTWSYGDRIVYFEHTHVIHVVASH